MFNVKLGINQVFFYYIYAMSLDIDTTRQIPEENTGLTSEQISERKGRGLINNKTVSFKKNLLFVVLTNVFSPINLIYYALLVFIIISKQWFCLIVFTLIIANIAFGILNDLNSLKNIKSERKLYTALRDGQEQSVASDQIVLDDIVVVRDFS